MTTIAEFKKMLQEEINEPLDYPRVPGLTPEELREYNEGYREACELILDNPRGIDDDQWHRSRIETARSCLVGYPEEGYGWSGGRRDAYTWALAELKALEPEGEVGLTITAAPPVRGHEVIDFSFITTEMLIQADDDPNSLCVVPRARYNYLLDLERQASEFVESFTRWEA